jgi:hypothetical protein
MSNGNGETIRKSHIQRIYKNDDPETGVWVDVERLDELHFVSKINFPWREKIWQFDWNSFDPNGTDLDGNEIPKKLVQDPNDDSDPNDPAASVVQVPVRAMVFVNEGKDYQWQGYKHYFINDDSNATRETHSRLVYHHDISEDYLDDDGNPPSDPQDYLNALGDQDDGQYLEVEILDKYWTDEHEGRDDQGNEKPSVWQEKKWLLDSTDDPLLQDPIVESDVLNPNFSPTYNPDAGPTVDPPWRLDPLQNIVNINFGGLAVIFGDEDNDAPENPSWGK